MRLPCGTSGVGYTKKERSVMVTESSIKHIRSLVKRGRKYEKPRWDKFELLTSIGGTLFLSSLLALITTSFDKNTQLYFIIALWVMMFSGAVVGLVGLCVTIAEDKDYQSFLQEIDEILEEHQQVWEDPTK